MIVCDTNVILSAFVFPGGFPDKVWRQILSGQIQHATSPDILTEVRRVLDKKFHLAKSEIESVIQLIVINSSLVYPTQRISVVTADETDNRILECADQAKAKWIVTGDKKHLLPIKQWNQIKIVSPKDFAILHGII